MPPLRNNKREKFCLACLGGMSASGAAVQAGYSARSARQIGSKLLTDARIRARLEELKEAAVDEKILSILERKKLLSNIARTDIEDFISEDGKTRRSNQNTPCQRGVGRSSGRTFRTPDGGKAITGKISFNIALAAIRELNRMEGLYSQKSLKC